jgi:hypothetical protein
MATRRNLDSTDQVPVKPPLGAELWPPRPLEEMLAQPDTPPAQHIDDLFSQGAGLWLDNAEYEQFLAWVEASHRAEG